jgi:hypothetical protein
MSHHVNTASSIYTSSTYVIIENCVQHPATSLDKIYVVTGVCVCVCVCESESERERERERAT